MEEEEKTTQTQKQYAIAYARVSTDDKDQNPESQFVAIRKWAREKNIEVLREYQDKSTGTNDDRMGLDAAYGYCSRTPEVTIMLVHAPDRLSRNMDDAPRIIKDFNSIGTKIVYITKEYIDVTTTEGKLMNAFESYAAQMYTDGLKAKIRAGLDRARAEGKTLGRPRKTHDEVNIEILMDLIRRGQSLRQCEKVFKVSRNTLRTIIRNSPYEDEYQRIAKERKEKPKTTETN